MSFLAPTGLSQHSCGYCHSEESSNSSKSYGAWAFALTSQAYQHLIDHGWRRSGQYLYKPTQNTCCIPYTIRLNVSRFQISKSQKRTIKKLKNFMLNESHDLSMEGVMEGERAKGIQNEIQDLIGGSNLTNLLLDAQSSTKKHTFKVQLVPSQFEQETFELYLKYQQEIHKDEPGKNTPESFKRFLVDSPIKADGIYGSFHQKYYIDNQLIAVGVLDILPLCVSSVYFMYDPQYEFLSLGTMSALREIGFTWTLSQSHPTLLYYYMGYYIHSCPKMKYKGGYKPSELLCPFTFNWVPLDSIIEYLDKHRLLSLINPTSTPDIILHSSENIVDLNVKIYTNGGIVYSRNLVLPIEVVNELKLLVNVLGKELSNEFIYIV